MTVIMGIDPGVTTGWAVLDDRDGEGEIAVVDCGQLNGNDLIRAEIDIELGGLYECDRAICLALVRLIHNYEPDYVFVEDFILRPTGIGSTGRDGVSPLRLISMLEVWRFDIQFGGDEGEWNPEWKYNTPADAKKVMTDSRLRAKGLYAPSVGQPHARDAIRHAALGFRKILK